MKNFTLILSALLCAFALNGQSTTSLKIDASGNVGIGFANPTTKLDVNGSAEFHGSTIKLGSDLGFDFLRTNSGSSRFNHHGTGQFQFKAIDDASVTFFTNNTTRMLVGRTGNLVLTTGAALKLGGGSWSILSDGRLKTNVEPYTDGINELMEINPVSFKYLKAIDSEQRDFIGIIAQDVREVVPYMVEQNVEDALTKEVINTEDALTVDPNAFTYMLINAVKEQQQELVYQRNEIEKLKQLILSLDLSGLSFDLEEEEYLSQNSPNPFTSNTTIDIQLPDNMGGDVFLIVTDMTGRVLQNIDIETNSTKIDLNMDGYPSGTYNYTLFSDKGTLGTKQFVISK